MLTMLRIPLRSGWIPLRSGWWETLNVDYAEDSLA